MIHWCPRIISLSPNRWGLNPHDQMLVPERPELVEALAGWLIE